MTTHADDTAFLSGGGDMGAMMRAHDWSASPLGPPEQWSQSLRTAVSLMLNSLYPMFMAWGPHRAFLYNDGYADILGDKHPGALGRPFKEVWHEIWHDIEPLVDSAFAGKASFHENLHLVMERHAYPEDTWYTFSYSPIRDETGGVGGMFCACQETTKQVLLERALANENERLQRMFSQAPGFMAMLRGPQHVFEFVNPAYMQLIGHRDVRGKPVREALPEVVGQGFVDLLDRVYQSGEAFTGASAKVTLQHSPNAPEEERFVDFVYQPIAGDDGQVIGIFVEGYDVTDRVRGEGHLRLLMNELNHRLKNTLATVQALIVQTLKGEEVEEARKALSARVMALSRAHDVLDEASWHGAGLLQVVEVAMEPFAQAGSDVFEIEGPPVSLSSRAALALSLAFHELATNAAKYGALSAGNGRVCVSWSTVENTEPSMRLEWRETGGPPVTPPSRKGFGTQLIERGLASELNAEVSLLHEPDGLVFRFSAPLSSLE